MNLKSVSRKLRAFHLFMAGVWMLLAIPTVIWWKESVLWVAILSLYANFASELAAYGAARAEESSK